MNAQVPLQPKIYHAVNVDRLPSIIGDGYLWCDAEARRRGVPGTTIGMDRIKERRLKELILDSHPDLHVGECVPFYFCPRSVMLFKLHKASDPELPHREGQGPIVHLEADLRQAVAWADDRQWRWAFTTSNAGSYHFDDYADLAHLDKLNWDAIHARWWSGPKATEDAAYWKQAEFLLEHSFPWELVERIGVLSRATRNATLQAVQAARHQPPVEVKRDWYY